MAEFGSISGLVDVLLVGAVNDLMRGKNATKIIRDLSKIKNNVLSMKICSGAGGRSTLSVAISTPGDLKLRKLIQPSIYLGT